MKSRIRRVAAAGAIVAAFASLSAMSAGVAQASSDYKYRGFYATQGQCKDAGFFGAQQLRHGEWFCAPNTPVYGVWGLFAKDR
ncbi:hypothetical protein [Crossiella sp. CA198]|uniref:hypothetical protein n=1 Tax=Crossiella sp. CA198 TaxID=3455607 RepID=UPI003F8D271B